MASLKAADAVSKIVSLVESVADVDRQKVMDAVLTLVGMSASPRREQFPRNTPDLNSSDSKPSSSPDQIRGFFEQKQPQNKIEELAVAARFLEKAEDIEECSKDDLARIFKAARRNFDKRNFPRDINNAKTKGLFNRGSDKGAFSLSHGGQNYVDQLPDRSTVKLPKGRKSKTNSRKKK